jgi:thiamine-phosphate pyrophosphorylase
MTTTLRGLYAITPDDTDPARMTGLVARVLEGGVDALQFRVKGGAPDERESLARAVKALTDAAGVPTASNNPLKIDVLQVDLNTRF